MNEYFDNTSFNLGVANKISHNTNDILLDGNIIQNDIYNLFNSTMPLLINQLIAQNKLIAQQNEILMQLVKKEENKND